MNHQNRRATLGALTRLPLMPVLTAPPARAAGGGANRRAILAAHERLKTAWNQRDAGTIAALLGDDGAFTTPYSNGTLSGGAAVARVLEAGTFAAFPDFSVQAISAEFVDGHTMFERWVLSGTWSGTFKAGPLTVRHRAVAGSPFRGSAAMNGMARACADMTRGSTNCRCWLRSARSVGSRPSRAADAARQTPIPRLLDTAGLGGAGCHDDLRTGGGHA